MIGLVIATHGELSNGLMDAVGVIMGSSEAVSTVSLKNEIGIEVFKADLEKAVEKVGSKDGVLIFTDLQGGTPYNSSIFISNSEIFNFNIKVVSGVNLPMLLETLALRENCNLQELASISMESGIKGINIAVVSNDYDEDDDL